MIARTTSRFFDDIDVNSNKLGGTVAKRNEKLVKLLNGVADMKLGDYQDNTIDAFGDEPRYKIDGDKISFVIEHTDEELNEQFMAGNLKTNDEDKLTQAVSKVYPRLTQGLSKLVLLKCF